MKKIRLLSILVVICLTLSTVCGITASAAVGPLTTNWFQTTYPTKSIESTYASNGQTVIFEGVATSPASGTFKAKLQYKNVFGSWVDDSNTVYTIQQHSNQTYSTRLGQYVTGQYFKVYWSVNKSKDFRVLLYDPTNPQATALQYVYLYT